MRRRSMPYFHRSVNRHPRHHEIHLTRDWGDQPPPTRSTRTHREIVHLHQLVGVHVVHRRRGPPPPDAGDGQLLRPHRRRARLGGVRPALVVLYELLAPRRRRVRPPDAGRRGPRHRRRLLLRAALFLGMGGTLELSARRGGFPCRVVPGQFH